MLAAKRKHVSDGMLRIVDNDALVGIIVEHARGQQEIAERSDDDVANRQGCYLQQFFPFWKRQEREGLVLVDGFGNADGLRSGQHHDAPMGGKEDGTVDLCDTFGGDADVARDGLTGIVGSRVRDFERPHAFVGESVERELSELALGERLGSRRDADNGAGAHSADQACREGEGIIDFGGVNLIGIGDAYIRVTDDAHIDNIIETGIDVCEATVETLVFFELGLGIRFGSICICSFDNELFGIDV